MADFARWHDMTAQTTEAPPLHQRGITLFDLFRSFFWIGATGFGGVLPTSMHELVRRRQWLTMAEFTEMLALCQVLPGPNVINLAIVFGQRVGGWMGALTAITAMMLVPLVAVMTIAAIYAGVADDPVAGQVIRAIAGTAAGLICAVTLRLLWPVLRRPVAVAIIVAVACSVLVLRLPLILVLAVGLPVAVIYGWWSLNDDRR
jgi:chromate transporter